jgi:hypothetical protein
MIGGWAKSAMSVLRYVLATAFMIEPRVKINGHTIISQSTSQSGAFGFAV